MNVIQISPGEAAAFLLAILGIAATAVKILSGQIWKHLEEKLEALEERDAEILVEVHALRKQVDDKIRERVHRIELALERGGVSVNPKRVHFGTSEDET